MKKNCMSDLLCRTSDTPFGGNVNMNIAIFICYGTCIINIRGRINATHYLVIASKKDIYFQYSCKSDTVNELANHVAFSVIFSIYSLGCHAYSSQASGFTSGSGVM
jgi:hypothetical protein